MHRHPDLPRAFAELGLEAPILRGILACEYVTPSAIQAEMIPHVLAGKDVLGQARTGTGKTAAFGLPILQMINQQERLQALVLTPTRELAAQVVGEFRRYAQFLNIHCVPVYGGTSIKDQLHQLGRKPHVAVGTPGRVMDLMERGALDLGGLRFAVLDEVDRMLDIGFRDDIRRILARVTHPHQTVFVSATVNEEIKKLAMRYMNSPAEVNVSGDVLTVDEVQQNYCSVDPHDKFRLLHLILKQEDVKLAIVFTNTKHGARKLAKRLHDAGIEAKEIHGDLVQEKREKIMDRFRKHKIPVLVATDLASRGIDVNRVSHIINYDVPQDTQAYVHRIGRTARMGAAGRAITFVTSEQGPDLTEIEMLINRQIEPLVVAGFSPSAPRRDDAFGTGRATRRDAAPASASAPAVPAAPTLPRPATSIGGKFPVARRFRRH